MATQPSPDDATARGVMSRLRDSGWLIDDRHRDMTESALRWMLAHRARDGAGDYAKVAAFSSTFAYYCLPRQAQARLQDLCSKLLVVIYMLDNATEEQFEEHRASTRRVIEARGPSQPRSAFEQMFQELVQEVVLAGRPAERFMTSWMSVCDAIAQERARGGEISLDELIAIRRETIFADVFVDFGCAVLRIDLSEDELDDARTLRRLSNDHMFMTNDIASLEKDMEKRDEPNIVLALQRDGLARHPDEAIDIVIDLCNQRAREVERERERVLERSPHARVEQLLELEIATLNGNLDTSIHLCLFRYKDFGLRRILRVRLND